MRAIVLLVSVLAMIALPVGAGEVLRMRVSPAYSYEPATLTIQLSVEPHATNRKLLVVAESPELYRSSEVALEGDHAPRTSVVRYRSLPAGSYDVHAALIDVDGRVRASEMRNVTVMGMGGVYREVERPERLVASERFDDAWYEGECLVTTTLVEAAGRTTVTTDTIYDSREIRDGVLKSGMETGVERSYERLEEMLPELVTAARR